MKTFYSYENTKGYFMKDTGLTELMEKKWFNDMTVVWWKQSIVDHYNARNFRINPSGSSSLTSPPFCVKPKIERNELIIQIMNHWKGSIHVSQSCPCKIYIKKVVHRNREFNYCADVQRMVQLIIELKNILIRDDSNHLLENTQSTHKTQ